MIYKFHNIKLETVSNIQFNYTKKLISMELLKPPLSLSYKKLLLTKRNLVYCLIYLRSFNGNASIV